MKLYLREWLLENWQRKLIAFLSAVCLWVLVNNSITITQSFTSVPVKVINLPQNKTVEGLLADGTLNRPITLTLTGTKAAIERLEEDDLEVVIEANKIKDDSPIELTKKNLVFYNHEIDIYHGIAEIKHSDFSIELANLITENVLVNINTPKGDPPQGYQFVDFYPDALVQTISGPERQVISLKKKGLELNFNLSEISKSELDALAESNLSAEDEIAFDVPQEWKRVAIPFRNYNLEDLNDERAAFLKITFLKQEYLPIDKKLPLRIFFPSNSIHALNPLNLSIKSSSIVSEESGLFFLNLKVYANGVSRTFLNIVKDNIEITLKAQAENVESSLPWSIEFIDPQGMENRYVSTMLEQQSDRKLNSASLNKAHLRTRFQQYMRNFSLVKPDGSPLNFSIRVKDGGVEIKDSAKF